MRQPKAVSLRRDGPGLAAIDILAGVMAVMAVSDTGSFQIPKLTKKGLLENSTGTFIAFTWYLSTLVQTLGVMLNYLSSCSESTDTLLGSH